VIAAQKRDPHREVPLAAGQVARLADPSRSPQEQVEREDWQRFLAGLPASWQHGLTLLRAGHSYEEVAGHLGVSVRTVARLIERVRTRASAPHGP
jgi:DNA-directed RNA polymerase specialized sigma24 family protein